MFEPVENEAIVPFPATGGSARRGRPRRGIRITMDGRRGALDNVFIERLWRSVKYEGVYLRDYPDGLTARRRLGQYFQFYNRERRHQGFERRTLAEVHYAG